MIHVPMPNMLLSMVWCGKKGIDETWLQNGFKVDQDIIYCRYAEILLTYAEAKIELNEIDNSVLDALNEVRGACLWCGQVR